MPRAKSQILKIDPGWLPTPEAINALPEPLRRYIHAESAIFGGAIA